MDFEQAKDNIDNIKIIGSFKRRYRSIFDQDDLNQICDIALWKTVENHDFKEKTKFTTSLYNHLQWEFWNTLKKEKSQPKATSVYDIGVSGNLELDSIIQDMDDLMIDYYVNNMTYKEMSEKYNCSLSKIAKDVQKSTECFKKIYTQS